MPIRLLPQGVSSKIAAGEVIERPASVVKELVENALDAGSTDIRVGIAAGGLDEIRVADNGSGIASDEAVLAFERFATSKLTDVPDLEAISTLGFRGEALPSIAAVSHVTLVSRTPDSPQGARVEVSEGETVSTGPAGAGAGTTMTVQRLFANFPARRKFMRSTAAESSRIQAVVSRYALAYPAVRFELTLEGRVTVSTTGSGDLREVLSDVYGANVAHAMLEVAVERAADRPGLYGMVSPASISRSNRSHITTFVNGRWVQDRTLIYSILNAYRGFLMERRFPIAVVDVRASPAEIDVNVHPSKVEVRFRREGPVFSVVQQAVRTTLAAGSPVPEMRDTPVAPPDRPSATTEAHPAQPPLADSNEWPQPPLLLGAEPRESAARPEPTQATPGPSPTLPHAALPALRVLGQVQSTYIAAEGPDGMYLVDQHAAHERVVFERVTEEFRTKGADAQSLMEPQTVELDPRQQELLQAQHELLSGLGFVVEHFGDRTYMIRAVSSLLTGAEPAQALSDVLDTMAEGGGFESWEERAAYSIACHGAIRANETLTLHEMSELMRQLEGCRQPHTCPHGRPTMIHLTSARLEREFGRTV